MIKFGDTIRNSTIKYGVPGIVIFVLIGCHAAAPTKKVEASGTAPRLEREYKYSLNGSKRTAVAFRELAEGIRRMVAAAVDRGDLAAAASIGESYRVDNAVEDFVYFDLYFDTPDRLCYRNDVAYRIRERFKGMKDFEQYRPYRIEFQAKVNRRELGEGFSEVEESRFEFRVESDPFGAHNPPPPPPWDLDEFVIRFKAGKYKNDRTWPARSVVDCLGTAGIDATDLAFEPALAIVIERWRMHLNVKTAWGSGPNPEQAFVVSIDRSTVYEATGWLKYWESRKRVGESVTGPKSFGSFVEIEVEFERNVSKELDRAIETREASETTRNLFLADQRKIMKIAGDFLLSKGIATTPVAKSKYRRAREMSTGGR